MPWAILNTFGKLGQGKSHGSGIRTAERKSDKQCAGLQSCVLVMHRELLKSLAGKSW
jgi:hypothetical protein